MFELIHRQSRKLAAAIGIATVLVLGTALPAHAAANPIYRITTLASLTVEVSGGSTASGGPVIQWPINGGQNQEWTVLGKSYGAWIVNVNSGKCLSVAGASLSAGANLVQYPCADVAYQEWTFEAANSGTANIIRNANSHQVIDVPGGTGNWGTQLIQWPSGGTPNQNFWFTQLA
jgi:hypothetical protein